MSDKSSMTAQPRRDGIERLLARLEADPALRRDLERAAGAGAGALLAAFHAAAARAGVRVSGADVEALLAAAGGPAPPTSDELDDRMLDAVSGGDGDDAQLANVDLQNILQKQQQTLQMMSNISKMLYDTAQSVVRKMGG
jgi:hypothetical protein